MKNESQTGSEIFLRMKMEVISCGVSWASFFALRSISNMNLKMDYNGNNQNVAKWDFLIDFQTIMT